MKVPPVLAGVDGGLAAGDGAAGEVGVAFDCQLEAVVPGADAGLLAHGGVVGGDFALAVAGVAATARADGAAGGQALALAGEAGGVLQALDVEVAADAGVISVSVQELGLRA